MEQVVFYLSTANTPEKYVITGESVLLKELPFYDKDVTYNVARGGEQNLLQIGPDDAVHAGELVVGVRRATNAAY